MNIFFKIILIYFNYIHTQKYAMDFLEKSKRNKRNIVIVRITIFIKLYYY